jgi:hypothetical protein
MTTTSSPLLSDCSDDEVSGPFHGHDDSGNLWCLIAQAALSTLGGAQFTREVGKAQGSNDHESSGNSHTTRNH